MKAMKKIELNKQHKKSRLLKAGLTLFLENGTNNVSIDTICRKADIAKGTFYLYFKDKDDILRAILENESKNIITFLFNETLKQDMPFNDKMIYFTNIAIDYFINNPRLLALFKRNFTLPIKLDDIDNPNNQAINNIVDQFINDSNLLAKKDKKTIYKQIYIVIEMIGSVAYSSICLNLPGPIEEIKPMILDIAKNIFSDL